MTDQLERDLAAVATSHGDAPAGAAGAATASSVRKLDGGPVEAAPAMKKPEDDDEIEVKGEYYPVLIHHKKQSHDTSDKDH